MSGLHHVELCPRSLKHYTTGRPQGLFPSLPDCSQLKMLLVEWPAPETKCRLCLKFEVCS
jgi:hypothetical protein